MNILKSIRYEKGLSQEQVAKACGISRATVNKIESKRSGNISVDTLEKICEFYGKSITDVLEVDGMLTFKIKNRKEAKAVIKAIKEKYL